MDTPALISAYGERLEAGDLDGLLALLADDCSLVTVFHPDALHGKDAIGAYLAEHLGAWSERNERTTAVIAEGDEGASELRCDGVLQGGRRVVVESLAVFTTGGGRIRTIRVYGDTGPLVEARV